MSDFTDIVKAVRVLRANTITQGFDNGYFVGIINPTIADEIFTFWSPKEAWRYAHWRRRYVAFLERTGSKKPLPPEASEFKMGWR